MASQDGAQEVVCVFDASGSRIDLELHYAQFNALLAQTATLESHAASTVKAVYAQVGAGLALDGVVFFLFKVNEEGYLDPAFNLPLDYMAENAGEGPDLGAGPIRMACRSQCPVPWHAINLWEPAEEGPAHPAMAVQKLVWRNRLGLKPAPLVRRRPEHVARVVVDEAPRRPREPERAPREAEPPREPERAFREPERAPRQTLAQDAVAGRRAPDRNGAGSLAVARVRALDQKLTDTFGEAGRVSVSQYTRRHREQVGQVAEQFRAEMQRQQQGYLEQIKSCRDEIQKLKSALRHEQERNRRLQQLLRGEP